MFARKLKAGQFAFPLVICLLRLTDQGYTQKCAPIIPSSRGGHSQHSQYLQNQLVIPYYSFQCNTTVTQWEARIHESKNLSRVEFQVWRLNRRLDKYQLAGSNAVSLNNATQDTITTIQRDRLILTVMNPELFISVMPGDFIGLFISGRGTEVKYRLSKDVKTYVSHFGKPIVEFDAQLATDPAFRRLYFRGAPLVHAVTDDAIAISNEPILSVVPTPMPTSMHSPVETPSLISNPLITEGWDAPDPTKQNYLIIGGIAAGGGIIILTMMAGIIFLSVQAMKHIMTGDSSINQDVRTPRGFSKSLFSPLQLDITKTKKRINLKNVNKECQFQEAEINEPDYCYIDNKYVNQITTKENLSYSVLNPKVDLRNVFFGGHVYDVPNELPPCEYEIPDASPEPIYAEYDDIIAEDNNIIYEDIV